MAAHTHAKQHTPSNPGTNTPVLKLAGIVKNFGAVRALRGADFEVSAGEVVALCGDNGAGKSTLVKTIAGVHQPDEGTIWFDGQDVVLKTPDDATELGIATVYQDLALCDNLDIVANMFLGREIYRNPLFGLRAGSATRFLNEAEMTRKAQAVLTDLQVTTVSDVHAQVASLSGGQRQAVAIARAVMWNSKVVVLDEPTAALGVAQTEQVAQLIKRLRNQGLGVVLISHDLHQVFELADRIDVLRFGARALSVKRSETTPATIVAAITGASVDGEAE